MDQEFSAAGENMSGRVIITNRHGLPIVAAVDACLCSPDTRQQQGTIFIAHGMSGFKEQDYMLAVAQVATELGYTAVRYDSTHSYGESGGDPSLSTITASYEDLTDVILWAKKQPWYREPFILFGHSMGGAAVLEYAHNHPAQVKGIAMAGACVSGPLSYQAAIEREPEDVKNWKETGKLQKQNWRKENTPYTIPWSHMEDRFKYDAVLFSPDMTTPLFLAVGSEDDICPLSHQQHLFNRWGGEKKELHVISGAGHTFFDQEHLDLFSRDLSYWLKMVSG